jgi:hypothetical protein
MYFFNENYRSSALWFDTKRRNSLLDLTFGVSVPFVVQVTANLEPVNSKKVIVNFDFFKIGGLVSVFCCQCAYSAFFLKCVCSTIFMHELVVLTQPCVTSLIYVLL